jgi:hypothetical protein
VRAVEGHPPPPKFGLRAKCNTPSQIHVVIFEGSSLSLMAFSKGGHTILKQYIYIRALKGWSYCFGRRS